MAGVFRRPFHRGPPRRIVHGVAGVVDVQAPGLLRRKHKPVARRDPTPRKPRTVPLLGVRQPGVIIPVARMVMERTRKILRARIRQPERVFIPTFQPAVGATPFPAKPAAQRLPVLAAARRAPIAVPTLTPAAVIGTPFQPRGPRHRKPVRMPVVAKRVVPGIVPGPGPTPIRPRQPVAIPPRHHPVVARPLPGSLFVPGGIPIPARQPAVRPPRHHPARARPLPGSLFVPGGVVLFIRQPRAIRIPHRFRIAARFTITAISVAPVIVCTAGVWSVRIGFRPCDDFRIVIDGPSADQLRISATIEFNG